MHICLLWLAVVRHECVLMHKTVVQKSTVCYVPASLSCCIMPLGLGRGVSCDMRETNALSSSKPPHLFNVSLTRVSCNSDAFSHPFIMKHISVLYPVSFVDTAKADLNVLLLDSGWIGLNSVGVKSQLDLIVQSSYLVPFKSIIKTGYANVVQMCFFCILLFPKRVPPHP